MLLFPQEVTVSESKLGTTLPRHTLRLVRSDIQFIEDASGEERAADRAHQFHFVSCPPRYTRRNRFARRAGAGFRLTPTSRWK